MAVLRDGSGPSSAAGALHEVAVLERVHRRPVVGRVIRVERLFGDDVVEPQPQAQHLELVTGHLLDLVGGVAGLDVGAQRPALHRLGQDHRRCADLLGGGLVGGVHLLVVVPAAGQVAQVVVAEVLDQLAQPRVGTEEVLADVGAGLDRVALELAVDGGVHLVQQHAVDVTGQQVVPARTPDHLDDVPPGAPEDGFELLDDLAVAPHGTVEPLQVAVDDPREVVEALASSQRDGAERLGLVGLAVAEEAPHPRAAGVVEVAVLQVLVEAGLVDRVQRAEAHRHGRELPEVRHQPRMRVAATGRRRRSPAGSCRGGSRRAAPRGRHGHRPRGRRGPGCRPGRRGRRRPCPGRSG